MARMAAGTLTYDVKILDVNGKHVQTERHPPKHQDQAKAAQFLAHIGALEPPPPQPAAPEVHLFVVRGPDIATTADEWRRKFMNATTAP